VTPFDQKGAVSFDTLGRHIDFLISNGVQAILPGGSTGEYYAQTIEERKEILNLLQNKWRAECRFMRARTAQTR